MDVRKRIKSIMKQKHLSIFKLAKLSGLSDAGVRNWYNEKRYVPSITALRQICGALNITMSQLFLEDEEMVAMTPRDKEMFKTWIVLTEEQKNAILILMNSYVK